METRNTVFTRLFGLNPLACVAIVAVAIALLGMAYFNYQAKAKEAQALSEMSKGFIGIMKMGEKSNAEAQRNLEKLEKELNRPTAAPVSDPPAQLPEYRTPQTAAPFSTP